MENNPVKNTSRQSPDSNTNQNPNSHSMHSDPMKHTDMKKPMPIGVMVLFMVVVLLLGGFFAYQYFSIPVQEDQNQTTNITVNETAGWKTYTNTEYGFEFKYPSQNPIIVERLDLNRCDDGSNFSVRCKIFASDTFMVEIIPHSLNQQAIHKLDGSVLIGDSVQTAYPVLIGGKQGYKYDIISSTNYHISGFKVPLTDNNYLEIYQNTKGPVDTPNWDDVISTFKFTNSNGVNASDTELLTTQDTVTKEGPGGLSIKIPKDIAQYLSGETKTFPNPYIGTQLKISLYGGNKNAFFKEKSLYPSGAEYWITIGEQKYGDDSYCNGSGTHHTITSKETYSINGYSFTQTNENDEEDGTHVITIFNVTNKNTCRYIIFLAESISEISIRRYAAEDPNADQKQIELMIKNTKISREYFNNLSEQIVKTVSAK